MTTTYTVAQALATNATGVHVADTAANTANNLSNSALVSRVSLFSISGNSTVTAVRAAALAAIGSQFSANGHTLTVGDTVNQLTADSNAAGLSISGVVVTVADTAANILAANSSIISHASAIAVTANATLTLAQSLSVADANDLGNLAIALHLNGNQLIVSDGVAAIGARRSRDECGR